MNSRPTEDKSTLKSSRGFFGSKIFFTNFGDDLEIKKSTFVSRNNCTFNGINYSKPREELSLKIIVPLFYTLP